MNTKHPTIVLNLPDPVALLIVYGRHVLQKMTNNAWFPSPDPPLATVKDHIDTLEASEAKAKGRAKGTAAARDLDEKVVRDDMKGLAGYAYKIGCQNPGSEAAIFESAGFFTRTYTRPNKANLAAFLGPDAGEIRVQAKAAKRGTAYEWQYSMDGGATWVALGTTTVAHTHLLGATADTTYWFRFRTTRRSTTTDWSEPVRITVH